MDPVSLTVITSAILAGAAASMKDTASAVVKDAYTALKTLIQRRYASVDMAAVEKEPDSEAKRISLKEDLANAGADGDGELSQLAKALVEAVERYTPGDAAAVGLDIQSVKAAFLRVDSVEAGESGGVAGMRVREAEFTGGIEIGAVRAGRQYSRGERRDDGTPGPR